jgi:hypothetical protein
MTSEFKLTEQEHAFVREAFFAGGVPKDPSFVGDIPPWYQAGDRTRHPKASDLTALALMRSMLDGKPDPAQYNRLSQLLPMIEAEGNWARERGHPAPYHSEISRRELMDALITNREASPSDIMKLPIAYND